MKKSGLKKSEQGKEQNFAYVKFENGEAINSKKDFLSIQILLLNSLKIGKNYGIYRRQELEAKGLFFKKMKSLKANLSTLERALPKVKMPKTLENETDKSIQFSNNFQNKGDRTIEDQLYEIQRKLNELQSRNV